MRQRTSVVAQEGAGVGREVVAPEVGLPQPVALDHGAHGAVQDEDALVQEAGQLVARAVFGHALRPPGGVNYGAHQSSLIHSGGAPPSSSHR